MERRMGEQLRKEAETLAVVEREKEQFVLGVKRRQAESEAQRSELLTELQAVR